MPLISWRKRKKKRHRERVAEGKIKRRGRNKKQRTAKNRSPIILNLKAYSKDLPDATNRMAIVCYYNRATNYLELNSINRIYRRSMNLY